MDKFTQFLDEILSDRSQCISADLLLDWVIGFISDEQRQIVTAHVEQCRFCEEDSRQLQAYSFEPTAPPERKPSRWLDTLWIARPAVSQLAYRRNESDLPDEQLFALRPDGNWLVFNFSEDETAVITLKLQSDQSNMLSLHGRVRGVQGIADSSVRCVWIGEQIAVSTGQLDGRGRFTIDPAQIGQCQLTIKIAEKTVILPHLIIDS